MIEKTRYSIIATALMLSFFLCSIAVATETYHYGFKHIVEDGDTAIEYADGDIGEEQMSFDVSFYETEELVTFTFYNKGPEASSITDIYFDDDVPLLTFASDDGSNGTGFEYSSGYSKDTKSGVAFSETADPGDLPGGEGISFTSNYDYDSDAPPPHTGVNPEEWVKLYFTLSTDYSFETLITALDNESFRVGIHVQDFASGGSESFVNGSGIPGSAVPEPATLLLLGFGMLGAAGISRKKII